MKTRHSKQPLPRDFINHPHGRGILAECDIGINSAGGRTGRLYAKLLVFDGKRSMVAFSAKALGQDHRKALGFVNSLGVDVFSITDGVERQWREVDPRYFCLICLVKGHLSMEIITHEAVHAACFYARRSTRKWPGQEECADEAICYPAGRIAAAINRFLHRKGLYSED